LQQSEMLDLCCYPPLVKKIEELIPTPMGVSLALSAWLSTTRTWHQDDDEKIAESGLPIKKFLAKKGAC